MTIYVPERERERKIVLFLRLLEKTAQRDADQETRDWVRILLGKVTFLLVSRGCSIHDVIEHLNTCVASDLELIEDEPTPAERPKALDLEAQRKGTWKRLLRWL